MTKAHNIPLGAVVCVLSTRSGTIPLVALQVSLVLSINHSRSQSFTTDTGPGATQETIPDGIPSSNGSFSASAASLTPWVSQPDHSLRPVQSSARPVESATTILRSANPSRGPVSGGIEIWLVVDDLPTTFTLYARFGNHVAATVSPIAQYFAHYHHLISILVGSEYAYAVMCASRRKSIRSCEGYTIPFSLS